MASALEEFVSDVRQSYLQEDLADVLQIIKKSRDVLSRNVQHLDNVLETLDVEHHSLAVMSCLAAKLLDAINTPPSKESFETLMTQLSDFLSNCNDVQIQMSKGNFGELCHMTRRLLIAQKCPIRGIELLRRAIAKVQSSPDELTTVHADLCQLCLLATCFKPVLPILDVDIATLPAGKGEFDVKHFLLYYYYGGMIYTAMKKYEKALYMFEVAVTTPARAVSHIMIEAYKKYILVSLILHGKLEPLPKWTSQVVDSFIKPLSGTYHELVNAYQNHSTVMLRATLTKHEAYFRKDKNFGLCKQLLTGLYKNNIKRLTKTFLTLSLADVAARVQLESEDAAEEYILHMIEDGEIFATVNKKDGMVVFHDDPEKYNSPAMLQKLEDAVTSSIELDRKVQAMKEEIAVNPIFVHKCTSQDDDSEKLSPYSM